ncbi:hypothetical protein GGR52DRAFT_587916 [Hypoxylon sp. FL1284]|nr:hypothetical protein GGR52DRAFT_587916 [Hypoxylon sp. FL1284]
MYFKNTCAALLGFSSLVASAPTVEDLAPASDRGLKWRSRRAPLAIEQIVQETNIVIVEDNKAQLDALQAVAELEFAQLVQDQVALATQLDDIKNNIRVNHFKTRFAQINTVIVTVATVLDVRAGQKAQKRYMVNQVLADNGRPDRQIMVMVSDAQTMTIGGTATATATADASAVPASQGAAATPSLVAADPRAPFGRLNESAILPIGAVAPSIDLVFGDPAAIVLPGQDGLFVESADTFLQDCGFYSANGNAFADIASGSFASFGQRGAGGDSAP